jgi:hypothetical protein
MAGFAELHDEIWELWRRALTPDPEITYICSLSFTKPDPEVFPEAEYSLKEVPIFVRIPSDLADTPPDHILYLRKNVKENVFEIHRSFAPEGSMEVIFRGSFTRALTVIDRELRKYRPELVGRFQKCEHRPPRVDRSDCPIFRRRLEKLRKGMEKTIQEIVDVEGIIKAHEERLRRLREKWERLRREMENLA